MYKDKIEHGLYQTSDIDLVAALSLFSPIVQVQRSGTHQMRVIFYFEATDEVTEYVARYRRREALVEPKAYYYQLRDVRSQINDLLDRTN